MSVHEKFPRCAHKYTHSFHLRSMQWKGRGNSLKYRRRFPNGNKKKKKAVFNGLHLQLADTGSFTTNYGARQYVNGKENILGKV
jgi:hypothetical protein